MLIVKVQHDKTGTHAVAYAYVSAVELTLSTQALTAAVHKTVEQFLAMGAALTRELDVFFSHVKESKCVQETCVEHSTPYATALSGRCKLNRRPNQLNSTYG